MSTPDNDISGAPMEPTAEAIDAWRAQRGENGWPSYGVDIKTKSGSWRCITERVEENGHIWYWTICGEGSSNEGRETPIRADQITQARKYLRHYPEMERKEACS
jgi:hypothetical protein